MRHATYIRYELLRTFRNKRFFVFSLGFPLALFFIIAAPQRHDDLTGTDLNVAQYFMVSMASFGTMNAMLSSGARIAGERAVGWNRQLRISPLSTRSYFMAKLVTAYLMALVSIGVLYLSGASLGVSLPAGRWLEMTGLILIGLVPFAALGILIGHLVTVDSLGPVIGGGTSLLALVSGTWFPVADSGFMHDLAQVLPSYWLVQAGQVGVGGDDWPARAWIVIAVWTVVLRVLATWAFRRDTQRP